MATVNLGLIKFRWQGAYAGGTAYVKDDVVSYNGSSYVCILASTGNLPTNTTYWNVMAQGGTDITSLAGLAQGDILYYNGTDWVRLGAGTSGQFLKTQGTGANPVWGTVSTSGLITNTSQVEDSAQYSHTNQGFTVFGSGVSYTPLTTTSQVMAFCNYTVQVYQDGTDNDIRGLFRSFSTNSSGNPVYSNSNSTDDNFGNVNMSSSGTERGQVTHFHRSCARDSSNNVVIKLGAASNQDPGQTTYLDHQQVIFMEIE